MIRTIGKDQIHQGKFGGMFSPEFEHSVLPPNETSQYEHYWNGRQTNKHYERVGFLHYVQTLFVPEYLHDSDRAIGDCRPEHRTNQYAPSYEWTCFTNYSIDRV